jgi:hypothetical protein
MRLNVRTLKSIFGKAILTSVVLGGFLSFFGASSASAETVVVERPRVVVRGGFYGPRFYGPRERIVVYPHRYWDAHFRCWRYR